MVVEKVFDCRFRHAEELMKMGADIKTDGCCAFIKGVHKLHGARVCAPDLRSGAALTVAALAAEGKNPFILDSKEPTGSYVDFIKSETRYSRLAQQFPDRAEALFVKAEESAKAKYEKLAKLADK